MEILLALLLWAQNDETRRALAGSDWFAALHPDGAQRGKELAETAERLAALARGLQTWLQGGTWQNLLAEGGLQRLLAEGGLQRLLANGLQVLLAGGAGTPAHGKEAPAGAGLAEAFCGQEPAHNPLAPVAAIADAEIVYALTRCLA